MSFINAEDPSKPNANGSRIFALILIVLFFIGIFEPMLRPQAYKITGIYFTYGIGLILTIASVIVGFKNRFETNDTWKTVLQGLCAVWNFIIPGIFIATTWNG
jgi:hypothetical protein